MSYRRLFANSFMSLAARMFNALIQVVSLPVLLKTFGREDFGLIVLAMSLNTFIAILQMGLPTGIPKFIAEWLAKKEYGQLNSAMRTVASIYTGIALLNGLVLFVVALFASKLFSVNPDQIETLRTILIITAITSCFSIPAMSLDQVLVGAQELGFISQMQMIKNIFFGGLVALVYYKPEMLSLTQYYAIQCGIMFMMIPVKLWKWTNFGSLTIFLPGWDFHAVWPLLRYCFSLMMFGVFRSISSKFLPVILAIRYFGNSGNVMSEYQVINNVQLFLLMLSGTFLTSLVPHISSAVAGGQKSIYQKIISQGTKVVWGFGALIGFGVIMLSKEVILIYVGAEYLNLQPWLIIYLLALMYNLYNPALSSVVLSSGRVGPLVFITGIGCVISILCCWFFAPTKGIGSISFAILGNNLVAFSAMTFWYYPKYFGMNPFDQVFKILLPPVVAGLVMCVSGRWVINQIGCANNWMNIGIGAIFGTGIYSLIIMAIYIRPQEVRLLVTKLRKV